MWPVAGSLNNPAFAFKIEVPDKTGGDLGSFAGVRRESTDRIKNVFYGHSASGHSHLWSTGSFSFYMFSV